MSRGDIPLNVAVRFLDGDNTGLGLEVVVEYSGWGRAVAEGKRV